MTLAAATSFSKAQNAPSLGARPRGRPRKTLDERDDGNRRQQVLQGAAKLFRRKGYGATTTRDIAAAAGMHSGSPFYHFKSKNALLYAVMGRGHALSAGAAEYCGAASPIWHQRKCTCQRPEGCQRHLRQRHESDH